MVILRWTYCGNPDYVQLRTSDKPLKSKSYIGIHCEDSISERENTLQKASELQRNILSKLFDMEVNQTRVFRSVSVNNEGITLVKQDSFEWNMIGPKIEEIFSSFSDEVYLQKDFEWKN